MSFWRQPRHSARIARAMLVVWLFALLSGWANACVLQDREAARRASHETIEHAVAAHGAGVASHGHAGPDETAGHDGDGSGARQLCQSVCDDEQSALPKVTPPSIPDLGPALLAPIEPWSFRAADAPLPRGCLPGAAPPTERPVAIRFLRLTI